MTIAPIEPQAHDADGITISDIEPISSVPTSWIRRDLGPALNGELEKIEPTILRRDDGRSLLYPGQLNWLHGADGIGKSWVALIAAAQEIAAGRAVEWIDLEDPDERTVVDRLLDVGIDSDAIRERFFYRGPTEAFDYEYETIIREGFNGQTLRQQTSNVVGPGTVVDDLVHRVDEDDVSLVVIDSFGEALGLEGGNENEDTDVTRWVRHVARPLIAAGVAVLVVDHATKSNDNPLFASGSKRKRAAITGAGYLVEAPQPLTRDHGGRLRLTCAKDRHGTYARGEQAATLDFGRYPDGGLTVHVRPCLETEKKPTPDQELALVARCAVRTVRDAHRPMSRTELSEAMPVKARATLKRAAIDHAVAKGALAAQEGARRGVYMTFVHDLEVEE